MVSNGNQEAVSPVIGTILMVAVTVILAAVIAMYVFGVPSNVTKTKVVAASAQTDTVTGNILITYQGGQNDDSLSSLKVTAPDTSTYYTTSDGVLVPSSSSEPRGRPVIGQPMIPPTPSDGWQDPKHVMVVGVFADGVEQIILDTYL